MWKLVDIYQAVKLRVKYIHYFHRHWGVLVDTTQKPKLSVYLCQYTENCSEIKLLKGEFCLFSCSKMNSTC